MQLNLTVTNADYAQAILSWTPELSFGENLYNYTFSIETSDSALGPWTDLLNSPIYAFGFLDTITQRGMIDQRIYYRVKASDKLDSIFYSNVECLANDDFNYISDYISRQQKLSLRRLNGKEFLHYARKKFGPRCSACYLETERKVFKSKCPVCFGTTYDGGYFAPVKISLNKAPQLKAIDKNDNEVTEAKNANFLASNDVILESDDILVSLKRINERYIVTHISPNSIHDSITSQVIACEQVKMDSPAQLIPVDYNAYTLNEFNVFRRDWKILK